MQPSHPPSPVVTEIAGILAAGYLRLIAKACQHGPPATPLPHMPRGRAPFLSHNPLDDVGRRAKVRSGDDNVERPVH